MVIFAWLIVVAAVSYLAYQWAMSATNRFMGMAIEGNLVQPSHKSRSKANSLRGFLILTGDSIDRLRAIAKTSSDPDVEAARKDAVFRWVLAPVLVVVSGVMTWVGLLALLR